MSKPAALIMDGPQDRRRFDGSFPNHERLPASVTLSFASEERGVRLLLNGSPLGDRLTDAKRAGDGYRFHDALHLALATRLGWSPVLRGLLERKRRSDPVVDECEDGGRACMVEETACHLIHVFREEARTASGRAKLIELLKRATAGFEVEACNADDWSVAISLGLSLQSDLHAANGGTVRADLLAGEASYYAP